MPEQKPADPRSPLAAAVEAHFDAYMAWVVGGLRNDDEALSPLCDTADALRAALDADTAWRARAEAAVAVMEAQTRLNALYATNVSGISPEAHERLLDDIDNTRLAAMAARRRYEEAAAGKPHA